MATKFVELFAAMAMPFERAEVKARTQAGRHLLYITARTVMNRLDNVLGPENWWDEYEPHENSVLCRLTIRLPDGTTLTKADAGGYAGMADQGAEDKSGFSDAFKRAAVKFGVARYLYRDGVPGFVAEHLPDAGGEVPAERMPSPQASSRPLGPADPPRPQRHQGGGNGRGSTPRTGKALFAWVREQEQKHDVPLLKFLNGFGKLGDFPGRMVEWDESQVSRAYAEAVRKLQGAEVENGHREPGQEG